MTGIDPERAGFPLSVGKTPMTLAGKTLFISGGSRGIGLAIALRAARDGANVALIAKTAEPHPKLEGTVYTAAAQIEAAGGRALPVVGDIRDEAQVQQAVAQAVERFGGIADDGIASNALWPRTLIATAAVQNLLGGEAAMARARRPELYSDAAYAVITRPSRDCTGNAFLCEDVLTADGVTDFDRYAYQPGTEPEADLFVDHA
jgi:NADPH:quinone reductase-like Zn-dependent oxidoreductase